MRSGDSLLSSVLFEFWLIVLPDFEGFRGVFTKLPIVSIDRYMCKTKKGKLDFAFYGLSFFPKFLATTLTPKMFVCPSPFMSIDHKTVMGKSYSCTKTTIRLGMPEGIRNE